MGSTTLASLRRLAGVVFVAVWLAASLSAAQEIKLKDETGKTILRYVIEAPIAMTISPGAVRALHIPSPV